MQAIGLTSVHYDLLFVIENTTFRNWTTNGTRLTRHIFECERMTETITCCVMMWDRILGLLTGTEKDATKTGSHISISVQPETP
jgi:hypothetical protein